MTKVRAAICHAFGAPLKTEPVSGRWTLDEINAAIADTRSGAARRNLIVFRASSLPIYPAGESRI